MTGVAEVVRIARSVVVVGAACPPGATLGEQLGVNAAPLVIAEAVIECVAEVVETEVPRAAGVGSVEEWAVVA
jgi:hypothetical protein